MLSGFAELMTNRYHASHIFIYICIIGASVFFAFLSQLDLCKLKGIKGTKRQKQIECYFQRSCLFMSFFILWFFSAFADCGADRPAYRNIFLESTVVSIFDGWQEPGFVIFNLVFRLLGDNSQIILIAISTVTLGLIYCTLYELRNEINIGYAVLIYGALFYVQSLSLMRMYMAAAMLFWGIRYLKREEYVKYGLVILVTTMIHYSSLIIVLPIILIYFFYTQKYNFSTHLLVISTGMCAAFLVLSICAPLLSSISVFARFQRYLENVSFGGIGVAQVIYNLPMCLLILAAFDKIKADYRRIFCSYMACHFFIAMLSYVITILGRAVSLFSVLYLFILPYCIQIIDQKIKRKRYKILFHLCIIGFLMFRFLNYIGEYAFIDMVIPYKNILL